MVVEIELRSFITKEVYEKLVNFFRKEGIFVSEDSQETHYLDTKEDLRIQKNDFFSKIWMKKGKMHDYAREEIEIKFDKNDFDKIVNIFRISGINTKIKWLRKRNTFQWKEIYVMLDETKGYGHIIELEKMSDEKNKEKVLEELKQKLNLLNIKESSKEEFQRKFNEYQNNWKEILGEN